MVTIKHIPLGETVPRKLFFFSVSKIRHNGVQKTYTVVHCRKDDEYKKCSSLRDNPRKIIDPFYLQNLGQLCPKKLYNGVS
jgi:hypothetical protein